MLDKKEFLCRGLAMHCHISAKNVIFNNIGVLQGSARTDLFYERYLPWFGTPKMP